MIKYCIHQFIANTVSLMMLMLGASLVSCCTVCTVCNVMCIITPDNRNKSLYRNRDNRLSELCIQCCKIRMKHYSIHTTLIDDLGQSVFEFAMPEPAAVQRGDSYVPMRTMIINIYSDPNESRKRRQASAVSHPNKRRSSSPAALVMLKTMLARYYLLLWISIVNSNKIWI